MAPDPELLALPAPPKRERTATVLLMAVTTVAALVMAISLRGEARYALSSGDPVDVGELANLHPEPDSSDRYVRAVGLLGTRGAIKYGRAAEGDSFRLAPVAGNPKVWVEIRVPEGFEGARFVPPTSFAGRLVPFHKAGIRHVGLARSIKEQTEEVVPADAWLLVDGTSPRASRWALALVALFAGFAAWNAIGVARMLSRVRDSGSPPPDEPALRRREPLGSLRPGESDGNSRPLHAQGNLRQRAPDRRGREGSPHQRRRDRARHRYMP